MPAHIASEKKLGNGALQLNFTNQSGASFRVLARTDVSVPLSAWTRTGFATETPASSGLFLFTDKPLPETSQVHMLVSVPGKPNPLSLVGKVSHTILAADEEPPGMGIVFDLDDAQRDALLAVIKELEDALIKGGLPGPALE